MTSLAPLINWRPQTPFYYGWLVLGITALGAFAATALAGVVLGGVQSFILEDTRWSRSAIGFSASAGVWLSGLFAPFAGRLADKYGPRLLMPLGALVLGGCMVAIGGGDSIWQFFIAAVVGRAISQPFMIGVVPRTLAVNFFNRRRNTALALTSVFRPISGAVIIQLFSAIAVAVGWRAAFRILGLFSIALTLPMLILLRRRPEDIGLLPDGARSAVNPPPAAGGGEDPTQEPATPGSGPEQRSWTAKEALRTRGFWLVSITAFLAVTGSSGLGFSLVPYLHDEAGLTTPQAAGVLSLATFLALSSLGWGVVADHVPPRYCMMVSLVVSTGCSLFLFQVDSLALAYLFGLTWGLFHSSLEVMVYMVLAGYFGRNSYGSIAGALRPFEAGGLGLGQLLGPVIYDLTGSYASLILGAAASHAMAAILIFWAKPPRPPAQVEEPREIRARGAG